MDKCTILLENSKSELLSTKVEHGLSLLIEVDNNKFIFDVGASGIFQYNAHLMNIDLSEIKSVVLSHSHYDHCSGLLSLCENQQIDNLYVGDGFFAPKYAKTNSVLTYLGCGFDQDYLANKNVKVNFVDNKYKLMDRVFLFSKFQKEYEDEIIPERFVHGDEDSLIKDKFEDEVVVVIENENSLSMIVGCAHRGILSMIKSVNDHFDKKVSKVIGGAHLCEASEERLLRTAKELVNLGVEESFFCHCSGRAITEVLKKEGKIKANNVATGDIIQL